MLDRILADVVVVLHFMFVVYAVLGGLLVLKWKFSVFVHVPALIWGAAVEAYGWICPLTPLENSLRASAGQSGYTGGFVEHYIVPVLYPADLTRSDQVTLAILLVLVNLVIYSVVIWKHLRARRASRA